MTQAYCHFGNPLNFTCLAHETSVVVRYGKKPLGQVRDLETDFIKVDRAPNLTKVIEERNREL